MQPQSETGNTADPASGAGQGWLGNSIWESPKIEISRMKSWPSIAAMSYHRDGGEATWRGDRHRLILARDPRPPMLLQVEQGRMRRTNQPLALIAQEAGFADQSHLTSILRRETGVTPGRFRAALA